MSSSTACSKRRMTADMAGGKETGGTGVPPVRRQDRRMKNLQEINALIERSRVCRLAMADGDQPYVVPMNFAYAGDCVYLHAAVKGRKLDILTWNPKVCLEFDECLEIIPGETACDTACRYNSVLAFGEAEILEAREDKNRGLKLITRRYTDREVEFNDAELASVAVIRISLSTLTGKSR
jgi:nitroimidazol reductase NimA-like FMN-containing flavoprotein (pyridoxamine 5'-phosphate oxidase superfamily)